MNHEEFVLAVAEHHKEQGWAQSLGFNSAAEYWEATNEARVEVDDACVAPFDCCGGYCGDGA